MKILLCRRCGREIARREDHECPRCWLSPCGCRFTTWAFLDALRTCACGSRDVGWKEAT